MAAPLIPKWSMNISNGSKMIFVTSPITAVKLHKLLNNDVQYLIHIQKYNLMDFH